jgi:hypothetical protein
MLPLTFDWAQISYIGSPLMTPFWAAANVVGGLIIVMWIAAPIMCMEILSSPFFIPNKIIISDKRSVHANKITPTFFIVLTCLSFPAAYLTIRQRNMMFLESSHRISYLMRKRTSNTAKYSCRLRGFPPPP